MAKGEGKPHQEQLCVHFGASGELQQVMSLSEVLGMVLTMHNVQAQYFFSRLILFNAPCAEPHGKKNMLLSTISPTTSILTLGQRTFVDETDAFVLPAAVNLYHGSQSKELAAADVPFPVGPKKYAPGGGGGGEEQPQSEISYYSSYDVARYYAGGGKRGVILAFKTRRPLTLFLLSVQNLAKFWPRFSPAVRANLATLYGYAPGVMMLTRPKGTKTESTWVRWLAVETRPLFDGVFVDRFWRTDKVRTGTSLQVASQDEVILFDACQVLERDCQNPLDWQHSPFLHLPDPLHMLRVQMGHYVTTNRNFHAGNLWEHSIWACLWTERLPLMMGDTSITEETTKMWSAVALLHDIGKCCPSACEKRGTHEFVYFAQPKHPQVGADYIEQKMPFPLVQDNGEIVSDALFMANLLAVLGLDRIPAAEVAQIVRSHWDLGPVLQKWKSCAFSPHIVRAYFDSLDASMSEGQKRCLFFVSAADILAAQPPSPLVAMQNVASRFWPLVNVPRAYGGVNVLQNRIGLASAADLVLFYRQAFGKCSSTPTEAMETV